MKTTIQSSAIARRTDPRRSEIQLRSQSALLLVVAGLLVACTSQAQTLLLSDNFNTGSYDASTFNDTLAADQGGTLATISYTVSAPNGGYTTQHGNGGTMLLVGDNNGLSGWASLNHNFASDAASQPLIIQFDAWVTDGASYAWLGFGIGSAQGTDFYSQPYGVNFTQSAGTHNYEFVISDTAGTGSGFNGVANGALVGFYIDGIFQGNTSATLGSSDGYLTFKQDQWDGWSIGHVDNLSISLAAPVPEPSTTALSLLGGLGCFAFTLKRRKKA